MDRRIVQGLRPGLEVGARVSGRWTTIAGGDLLTEERPSRRGYTGGTVSGFAFRPGRERMARLRTGINDLRELWRPPYVPAGKYQRPNHRLYVTHGPWPQR